jgi:hypothetical protein
MMISSDAPPSTSCITATNGSLSPMAPSTWAPAAWSSNGRASSSVVAASSVSGSQYGRGTSRESCRGSGRHAHEPRPGALASPRFGEPPPRRTPIPARTSRHSLASLPPRRGLSRPTLSQLGASSAGETHRAEGAYDHLNVLDAPHPWTVHRDRGAVAWRFNPQPAARDQRGGATRRRRDRWRLLRLEPFRLLRVAPQRPASRAALRP